jgi:YggT family protein
MPFLLQTFNILVDLFITLIVIRSILSWMIHDQSPLMDFLLRCTEPVLEPIRRLLPRAGGLDFSPLVAWLLLDVLRALVNQLFI